MRWRWILASLLLTGCDHYEKVSLPASSLRPGSWGAPQTVLGLVTLLNSLLVTYLIYRNWRVDRDFKRFQQDTEAARLRQQQMDLRFKLFERRLTVYRGVWEFLVRTFGSEKVPGPQEISAFRSSMSEAEFLFGPEVADHVENIRKKAAELFQASIVLDGQRPVIPGEPLSEQAKETLKDLFARRHWFFEQISVTKETFGHYMDLQEAGSNRPGVHDQKTQP